MGDEMMGGSFSDYWTVAFSSLSLTFPSSSPLGNLLFEIFQLFPHEERACFFGKDDGDNNDTFLSTGDEFLSFQK